MKNQQQIEALAKVLKNHEPYSKGWLLILKTIRQIERQNTLSFICKVLTDRRFKPELETINPHTR